MPLVLVFASGRSIENEKLTWAGNHFKPLWHFNSSLSWAPVILQSKLVLREKIADQLMAEERDDGQVLILT